MYNIVLFVHIGVSALLVVVILIQRGRGGGLVEALSGAESLFGTKTSSFLVKTTTTLAIVFFITSTSLAFLSKQRSRSIFETRPSLEEQDQGLEPGGLMPEDSQIELESEPGRSRSEDVAGSQDLPEPAQDFPGNSSDTQ